MGDYSQKCLKPAKKDVGCPHFNDNTYCCDDKSALLAMIFGVVYLDIFAVSGVAIIRLSAHSSCRKKYLDRI